ncbi:MAG: serine hydrolase domain-containing protein [Pirellulaceae bacterium]
MKRIFGILCAVLCGVASSAVGQTPTPSLIEIGTSDETFASVGPLVTTAIAAGEMPGAVVVFADAEKVRFAQAFGDRQIVPERQPMTLDTVFDLASISKSIGTATSVMILVDQAKIDLKQHAAEYLSEFGKHGKDAITIEHLLVHTSGLTPDNALADYQDGQEVAWQRICDLKLRSEPGEKFAYSDVGFIVLGKLVQQVSGMPLDQFARERIFSPLGMSETSYNPPADLRERAATTETRDDQPIKGVVHDPRAHLMGGVAGHAGVFSTAGDMVRFGQAMLRTAKSQPSDSDSTVRLFQKSTFDLMTQPRDVHRGTRTFGWDHQSPYSRNRGTSLSDAAFGHGGFTGTVMWIDPAKELVFIFLSSRLHPDGKGSVNDLAGELATHVGAKW